MHTAIQSPKTALASLLDRILAKHIQHACGLFGEEDLRLASVASEFEQHLKWMEKRASQTIQMLQPGLTREEIDDIIFWKFPKYSPVIPEEIYQLYQWRNGMVGEMGWNDFIHTQSFVPLQTAIERYVYNGENWFEVFHPQSDNCGSFILILGDPQIAPVILHPGCYEHGSKFPSLTHFVAEEFIGGEKTLAYADLANIKLPSANLRGVDCCHANMQGANLVSTNLREANLSYADLTGSNLSLANLAGVNLAGANLTGAVLKEANLFDADLTDTIFSNTVMPNGMIL
jgi:hypothetical protein